jgi:hypothetical protein
LPSAGGAATAAGAGDSTAGADTAVVAACRRDAAAAVLGGVAVAGDRGAHAAATTADAVVTAVAFAAASAINLLSVVGDCAILLHCTWSVSAECTSRFSKLLTCSSCRCCSQFRSSCAQGALLLLVDPFACAMAQPPLYV